MIKIAICDDEEIYRNHIKEKCEAFFQTEFGREYLAELSGIDLFTSGEELMSTEEEYDILFLDIELPGQNGIEVKNYFKRQREKTRIIFLTNYDEWMKDAFGKNVVDFLIKSTDEEKFESVMKETLLDICGKIVEVKSNKGRVLIQVRDIKYIKAAHNYTHVVMDRTGYQWILKSMKEWEEILPSYLFCRIHQSYIVNFDYFVSDKRGVILDEDTVIKLRKLKREKVMKQYEAYLREKIR